jgi:hypothetical protein
MPHRYGGRGGLSSSKTSMHHSIRQPTKGSAKGSSYQTGLFVACFKLGLILMAATLSAETVLGATPLPDGFTSKLVNANGQQIHCVVGGSGCAIRLVHTYHSSTKENR